MLMLTSFLPLFAKNLPYSLGSFHVYQPLWIVSLLYFHPRLFFQKSILYMFLLGAVGYFLLNTIWIEMHPWFRKTLISDYFDLFMAITIILYFVMERDYKGLARLAKWTMIFMGVTAVMSIYAASINPMYGRMMGAPKDIEEFEYFSKLGGGGYGFASALLGFFPMLFYYYRRNTDSIFSKAQLLIFGLLFYFAIIKIQLFGNILVATGIILVSLYGRKGQRHSLVLISFLVAAFLLIPTYLYTDLLVSIGSLFDPDSVVYAKLTDMAVYITSGDRYATGAGGRADRYPMLLEAFSRNPFFGYYAASDHSKTIVRGAHLFWMSRLAILGIFGIIPILLIHISYIKTAIKHFNKDFTFYFLLSVFAILSYGLIKNIAGRETWLTYFVILPGMYFLPLLKKRKLTPPDKEINKREKSKYPTWLL